MPVIINLGIVRKMKVQAIQDALFNRHWIVYTLSPHAEIAFCKETTQWWATIGNLELEITPEQALQALR